MMDLSKDGYSHEEIKDVLHMAKGSQTVRFNYHLLDKDDNFKTVLAGVQNGQIQQSAFSDIKRTAKFTINESTHKVETFASWGDIGNKTWGEM